PRRQPERGGLRAPGRAEPQDGRLRPAALGRVRVAAGDLHRAVGCYRSTPPASPRENAHRARRSRRVASRAMATFHAVRRNHLQPSVAAWAIAVALLAPAAQATDHWVANGGADGGPGTLGSPWQTVQHAVESVAPGDTIFVRAGTYVGARIE